MNAKEIKESWNEQKAKLKKKFSALTDNDLTFEDNQEDEMLGQIQKKLGKTKEEWKKIIAAL